MHAQRKCGTQLVSLAFPEETGCVLRSVDWLATQSVNMALIITNESITQVLIQEAKIISWFKES